MTAAHSKLKILITGATGRMATSIRRGIEGQYDLVRLYVRSAPAEINSREEVVVGELEQLDALKSACQDMDVVVHLGGKADEAAFSEIMSSNILGTFNVFEAARTAGVRRVVFASSHHVTGFYPLETTVGPDSAPRPDTLYATSKVFGEALGRMYHDKWNLEVACLRVGVCRPAPENYQHLRTWLSEPDSILLIRSAIESELDGYTIVYGVSDNPRSFWQRDTGALDFTPQDSAEAYADNFAGDGDPIPWQGGAFTAADYRGGIW